MKTFLSVLFIFVTVVTASGQSYTDALRYSFISPQGSARFAGTGGSLTPLGVDVTTLHTNPAGIGWNRYNLAQITPGFSLTNSDALLQGSETGDRVAEAAATFTLPSIGLLLAGNTRSVNMSTLNFGVSLTRMADYNQELSFAGRTPGGLIEKFAEDDRDGIFDPYGSDLAVPFLIRNEDDGLNYSDFYNFDTQQPYPGAIQREGVYDRRGSMSEAAIGFGGNFKETLLWGVSIGIPFFNYEQNYSYEEVDDQDVIPAFENTTYNESLTSSGTGFNLKAGITVLPTEQIRISAAVHTPTFWSISEQYSNSFGYFYSENGEALGGTELSPLSDIAYNLRTPWRFMAGIGTLVGERGFISLDADYAQYASNEFSFDDFASADAVTDAANADIDALLGNSFGLRAGGELNLDPFQARIGVGYRQVPYQEYVNDEDEGILTYSAGLGYSKGKFFADVAAQVENYSSFQYPYQTFAIRQQNVLYDRTRVSVLLTVGFRGFASGF
ncbi:hypothetical protein CLV84_3959 [Neolewinella xylanilytica]|uniref:Long-subunit fatty acid transport protein n=1 Tax=Neolewinella xylanilytica TaxID=1514080 RepID=A0A2S6I1I4_9BACT|nr:hypothetical protein [Neolewinella xylanilytica]PPK84795.1 hypothetical protein CLV84_3959 [Neolewinella xylanilytica]